MPRTLLRRFLSSVINRKRTIIVALVPVVIASVISFLAIPASTKNIKGGDNRSAAARATATRLPQPRRGDEKQNAQEAEPLKKELFEGHEAVAGEVLVKFRDEAASFVGDQAAFKTKLLAVDQELDADSNIEVGGRGTRRIRSRSKDVTTLVYQLSARPDVLFAEPNYLIYGDAVPNDTNFLSQWNMRNNFAADIDAVSAWNATVGSPRNPVVAVLDTGVDYNHPDLTGNMWSAPTAFTVTLNGRTINCAAGTHGFNTITKSCDPLDDNGHGTHVAGIIGATGNNGLGVAGVNWATSIMAIKLLDSTGAGVGTIADTLDAFEFVRQVKLKFAPTDSANVRVLNTSWGEGNFSQALLDEINAANSSDMLLVASAGNTGTDNDATPHYPSGYNAPNVVAVAATDNHGNLTSFSNFGASGVDLAAPGLFINSTLPGSTYGSRDGTSQATPHVAGAAALLLSRCALTTSALKAALLNNTDPDSTLTGKVATGGRLNVDTALRNACGLPNFTVSISPASRLVSQGSSTTYTITVTATGGFTGTVTVKPGVPLGATGDFLSIDINTSGTATLTVTNNNVALGTHPLLVRAVSGDMHRTALTSLTAPDYFISAMPSAQSVQAGNSVNYTASLTPIAGFTGPVTFSTTGLPVGATTTFTPPAVTTSGSTTLKVNTALTTTPGTYSFNIVGTAGGTQRTVPAVLTVTSPPPDFVFTGNVSFIRAVNVSLTDKESLAIVPVGGFNGTVSFSVSGLPAGAKAYFSPQTISTSGSTLMSVDPGTTNVDGTFPLTITASSGSLSHSVTTSLIIPNSTFGTDGRVIDTLNPVNLDNKSIQTNAMILQPDGKILVAVSRGGENVFAVQRFNSDGSRDTSFGSSGVAVGVPAVYGQGGFSDAQPAGLALQPDGKILVVGRAFRDYQHISSVSVLMRFNSNGSLDNGAVGDSTPGDHFGDGPVYGMSVYYKNSLSINEGRAVVVQPDGHIIVLAVVNGEGALLKYNSSGAWPGLPFVINNGFPRTLAAQADGKLVVGGSLPYGGYHFWLARFNSDFSIDDGSNLDSTPGDSFGSGQVYTPFESSTDPNAEVLSLAIQSNGKIVAAGKAFTPAGNAFALARYNSNGTLDTTFDQDGKLTTKFGIASDKYSEEQVSTVAIQPDGKIVAAGYALIGPFGIQDYDFALARYNSNGSLDTGFGNNGKKTTDFFAMEDKAHAMVLQPDGKILLAGEAKIFFPGRDTWRYWQFLALARYNGQTYSIGGKVTSGATALSGVTVNLSGSRTAAVTTDGNGNYSFTNLAAEGNYTVTPSKTNYNFNPAGTTYTNLSANQTRDFAATLKTYTVSGVVKLGTTGMSGVTVKLTSPTPAGFTERTATTSITGAYSFTNVPAARSYTVTPTKTGYQFTPANKALANLSASQTTVNFAVKVFSVGGTVKLGTAAVPGVTMKLTSPTPSGFTARTATTSAAGGYSFTNVPAGRTYVVTPTKTGYQFTPPTKSLVNLSTNQTAVSFLVKVYSISGRVTRTGTTTGIQSVTMTLTSPTPAGFAARTVSTSATGAYTFTNLPAGRNYTIKPTRTGYTFSPVTRDILNLSANILAGATTGFSGTGP